jgi:hypothetical protein
MIRNAKAAMPPSTGNGPVVDGAGATAGEILVAIAAGKPICALFPKCS